MGHPTDDDEEVNLKWRVALRKSGNPYAFHYYQPEDSGSTSSSREQYRTSQNPYAFHHYFDRQDEEPGGRAPRAPEPPTVQRRNLSKADFERGCRLIFRRYMPELERAQLRAHHQEFIRRNSNCSPTRRHALLEALRKYDLSSEPGLRTYFNREEDTFTEAKLLSIEEIVKDE